MNAYSCAKHSCRAALIAAPLAAFALLADVTAAHAQDYPSRTVRVISPTGPGAGLDIMARLVVAKLGSIWNQTVVLEHRPGTTGIVATLGVKSMPADGHHILIISSSYGANAALYDDPGYDYRKDFAPIAGAFNSLYYFVVRGDGPIKSVADLIALARKNPGKLNYGTGSQAWSQRLGMEKFRMDLSLDMVYIPYKGAPESVQALLAGDIQLTNVGLPAVGGLLRQGRVRLISVGARERSSSMPDVPTMEEAGGPRGFESGGFTGFAVRSEVPAPIRERLQQAMVQVQKDPEIRAFYKKSDFAPLDLTGDAFRRYVFEQAELDAKIIRAIGAKASR